MARRRSWKAPALAQGEKLGARRAAPQLSELGIAGDLGAVAHYVDPAYYTKTYRSRTEDVYYYVNEALASGGPVLEYGVGNGRIALPMARAGIDVTGIDLSAPMLDSLRTQLKDEAKDVRGRIELRRGDMRRVKLKRRFPLVIASFNTVLHLYERQDMERFLACVHHHLTPKGRFVFDFSMPHPADLCLDPDKAYGAPRIRHPTTGELTRYAERFVYDPLRQVLLVNMDFMPEGKSPSFTVPLTHRQYFPAEMEALLHYNGFRDIDFRGDFSDNALDEDVESLIVSCRPQRGYRP